MTAPTQEGWYWIIRKDARERPQIGEWDGSYFRTTELHSHLTAPEEVVKWLRVEPPADFLDPAPG